VKWWKKKKPPAKPVPVDTTQQCLKCGITLVAVERWAFQCPKCGAMSITRRSFLVGALATAGLVAVGLPLSEPLAEPKLVSYTKTYGPVRVAHEVHHQHVGQLYTGGDIDEILKATYEDGIAHDLNTPLFKFKKKGGLFLPDDE
jgi:hypothetical protein